MSTATRRRAATALMNEQYPAPTSSTASSGPHHCDRYATTCLQTCSRRGSGVKRDARYPAAVSVEPAMATETLRDRPSRRLTATVFPRFVLLRDDTNRPRDRAGRPYARCMYSGVNYTTHTVTQFET